MEVTEEEDEVRKAPAFIYTPSRTLQQACEPCTRLQGGAKGGGRQVDSKSAHGTCKLLVIRGCVMTPSALS